MLNTHGDTALCSQQANLNLTQKIVQITLLDGVLKLESSPNKQVCFLAETTSNLTFHSYN